MRTRLVAMSRSCDNEGMRQFHRIVRELRTGAVNQTPGEILRPPAIMPSIELEGRRLAYVTMKPDEPTSAPPIVFVHGFGGFFLDWVRVMANLAHRTRVYALDLPGWGFSEANPKARGIEDDAEAVGAFLAGMGIENAILVGLSYGAGVVWAAAARRTPNVQQAVLLNPMPPQPLKFMQSPVYQGIFTLNTSLSAAVWSHRLLTRPMYELICREMMLGGHLPDPFYLDLGFRALKQPGVALLLHAHAKAARDTDWIGWERELARIDVPVSILQSAEDRIFNLESARHLQKLIPDARLIEVEGSGHAMAFDQHRKVSEFLCSIVPKAESCLAQSG